MSEETLDSSTRNAILGQLIKPKVKEPIQEIKNNTILCECGHVHEGKCSNKYCSCTRAVFTAEAYPETKLETFGTLLEQSLEKRQAFDKNENEGLEEAKKKIIAKSNFNIIKNWRF